MSVYTPPYQPDEAHSALNPVLYNKLRNHFSGGVVVANQGEPFLASWHRNATGKVKAQISTAGEYYRVHCPFCKDGRQRLWINHMYGQPDPDGRPIYYLATCYNEDCMEDYHNRKSLQDTLFGFHNMNERPILYGPGVTHFDGDFRPGQPVSMPGQLIPVSQLARSMPNHPAVQYMCGQRRYTSHMLDHYEISYCVQATPNYRMAHDRIVFPIYMEGNLVGWQARYIGTADWKVVPKYYGLPGMKKSRMLYNYDHAIDKPFVIVVEGPTDAHVLSDYGVSLLGKNMSHMQMQILVAGWPGKPVILVLDPEAREETDKTISNLINAGVVALPIHLPEGYDCGDYDRATLWNIIHSQARQSGIILPT